ncbi:alpha-galactosidase [Jeotgalibacillus haloalkalitolerans]|uniref:Alpha-galactosidase n=1 Tax=Jeotgalibacillus haloalkalitolerans TaxID=3104292 RepID=A0ABU5KN62_9BACL|nr:alpha-galactosidase [Jeotgalibacillus sp. HH7-29]MDZ5712698.1 alpha-galactosidase [Jeotgalibacillus sp. HH7-29]
MNNLSNKTTGIFVSEDRKTFHLQTEETSYIIEVHKEYLTHVYWGKRIDAYNGLMHHRFRDRGFSPNPDSSDRTFSLDTLPQEYPSYGHTDFRDPAVHIQWSDGSTVSDFRFSEYEVSSGKPALEGLPHVYAEAAEDAETLVIRLKDQLKHAVIELSYSVFGKMNAITRSARFVNEGTSSFHLQKCASVNVDFTRDDFDVINLPGAHEREREMERSHLGRHAISLESRRGSSSHQQNPFLALAEKGAGEEHGDVYAFNFVYSGSFKALAEVDQFKNTRVNMGIHPFDFNWLLEPGDAFQTPEAVLVYSDEGLGKMSRTFHQLYNTHLVRGEHKGKERPVLINNWEATYFDFTEEKIKEIIRAAAGTGIELFVLDDGWFGKRDDDKRSLGDWIVHTQKLPGGLSGIADQVNKAGMKFGLWFEPEMVSPDSELYRKHPNWCLHVPGRRRSESRSQLVLDFANPEVRHNIVQQLKTILSSANIDYVKWDMNRNMTEIGSPSLPAERQRETAHRYMLGLYEVMEEITAAFPHILFESCSGGGGRFDPGMLYYMPQTWTSDNTDAISRASIQYGTSLAYPTSTMGAHVSASPNHQTGRITSLKTRGHVAMEANFGYELDVTKMTEAQLSMMSKQIESYKSIRSTVQFGDLYRLQNVHEHYCYATIRVRRDQSEAVFLYLHILNEANGAFKRVKLRGLDSSAFYYVDGLDHVYGGDELMNVGVPIPYPDGDFDSLLWCLKKVEHYGRAK